MEKTVIALAILTITSSAFAADLGTKPCASFAQGVAESLYLTERGAIQDHVYQSNVTGYKTLDSRNAELIVSVDGADEDGYTWTANYSVVIEVPRCAIVEIHAAK
ncbi:hypothetical protein D3C72_2118760 [compost metagenome]